MPGAAIGGPLVRSHLFQVNFSEKLKNGKRFRENCRELPREGEALLNRQAVCGRRRLHIEPSLIPGVEYGPL